MKKTIILLAIAALFVQAYAQDKWSLEECIDYALENNIVIKQNQINTEYRANEFKQSKNNRLPELSGYASQGFGKSTAPDNTYGTSSSITTNVGVNANVLVWRGGTLKNSILQNEFEFKSSIENLNKAKDDITLNIASGYLEILFAQELIKVAETQVEQTKKQIERTKTLVDAGKVASGALLEIESQLAREELDVVNRSNNLQIAYLNLAQFLELEDYSKFEIAIPEMPEIKAQSSISLSQGIFEKAVEIRPEIKSAEYQLKSTETQLDIAKAGNKPVISLSASLNDQYYNPSDYDVDGFGKQFEDQLRQNVSLNVNIPIFSKFQNRTNIENSKLQIKNQELELEKVKKDLRKQIEQAYTNSVAALKRYNSNMIAVKSMKESFRYIEEKYSVGRVNSVEYNDAKTNLANAESGLIQAKYDFIFRSKILDFYNGIPIEL